MSNSSEKPLIDKATVQKILSPVPYEKGFHFFVDIGKYTGETAISLFSFLEELRTMYLASVRFHFQRHDFQNWIKETMGDNALADEIDKIDPALSDQNLKEALTKIVQTRFIELQTLFNKQKEQKDTSTSREELKKFKLEELTQYNGQDGKPIYIVFDQKVYDVSTSNSWAGGTHKSHKAGKDLTPDILAAPHGDEVLAKVKQIGTLIRN